MIDQNTTVCSACGPIVHNFGAIRPIVDDKNVCVNELKIIAKLSSRIVSLKNLMCSERLSKRVSELPIKTKG